MICDVPGVALALACLWLERAWRNKAPVRGLWLGLLIGLCTLVRTMNLLLVPAILVAGVLRRGDGPRSWLRGLLLVLGTTAAVLPWVVRNAHADLPSPADQTAIHS